MRIFGRARLVELIFNLVGADAQLAHAADFL
jgi:hypothetical protein